MKSVTLKAAGDLIPEGLRLLVEQADAEGVRNVRTLVEHWVGGREIYDRPGEAILAAVSAAGEVVGVGGITRCPTVSEALRVRRFYVHPSWRHRGIASTLASTLISDGFTLASVITCNAGASTAAPPFWEAMGFKPVDIPGITHVLRRSDASDQSV